MNKIILLLFITRINALFSQDFSDWAPAFERGEGKALMENWMPEMYYIGTRHGIDGLLAVFVDYKSLRRNIQFYEVNVFQTSLPKFEGDTNFSILRIRFLIDCFNSKIRITEIMTEHLVPMPNPSQKWILANDDSMYGRVLKYICQ